jgi:hypothetical protein
MLGNRKDLFSKEADSFQRGELNSQAEKEKREKGMLRRGAGKGMQECA